MPVPVTDYDSQYREKRHSFKLTRQVAENRIKVCDSLEKYTNILISLFLGQF